MPVSIRPATLADADHVASLTSHLGYEVAAEDVADRLSRTLAREDQRLLIAEMDGKPAGWIHVGVADYIETGPFAVINGLVVDRGVRSQGIGRLLLAQAEAWARERGLATIRLWSTVSRERAHAFYERAGYQKIKTQYAFAKSLDGSPAVFTRFTPRVE
jgi:GNAT superfamily N-acetyltransferase